tara:strand:- start:225 stop:407 length:183 start_codon:yes stop_codon:yes gene_type:complete
MMGNVVFVVSTVTGELDEIFTRRCKAEAYIDKELKRLPHLIAMDYHIDVYELDTMEDCDG